jgi:two-component system chemotaxis response regulator CheB
MPIKVLVVDDSALIRQLLSEIINNEADMLLVGAAPDAFVAKRMVQEFKPNVITLDIEMPKVDGLRFLEVMMKACPTPVVMVSTLTEKGADATLRSLELGAVDFVPKPKLGVAQGMEEYRSVITEKIRMAAHSTLSAPTQSRASQHAAMRYTGSEKVIGIGASTGGTEAIKDVLMHFPRNAPATVITQHMPPGFTTTYARRLNSLCEIEVSEAKGGERLLPGHAYLAPGDKHLVVERSGADYRIALHDGARESGHKPSVDVLFNSLATNAGANAVGVLLTGMGRDGANGLLQMKQQGATTFCQDEKSCVVFGMPKVAIELNAATYVTPLASLADAILDTLESIGVGTRL